MTGTSRGSIGTEFVIATAIFLSAFWFIYLQSALMLTPQFQRGDVREPAVNLYSTILATDAGEPVDWAASPDRMGFAAYDGKTLANILDENKLDWAGAQDCSGLSAPMGGMEFAFRVTTASGSWECSTAIPEDGVVQRAVYVLSGNECEAGVLEVWAA